MPSVSPKPANGQPVSTPRGVALVPPELDDDSDLFRATVEAARVAMSRPLTTEEVEPFMYRPDPEPEYIPTEADWAEYRAVFDAQDLDEFGWSVWDHLQALNVWLTFFPE